MRVASEEKALNDSALASRFRQALDLLPNAERREVLAAVAAKGGAGLSAASNVARILGAHRTDPRLMFVALGALFEEGFGASPELQTFRRIAEGGFGGQLLPEGFSAVVLHEGTEFLAPLVPLIEPTQPADPAGPPPPVVHLHAPVLPADMAGVSTGEAELRANAPITDLSPEREKALQAALLAIPHTLPKGHLAVVILPSWALGESTLLAKLRAGWINNGALRRVVEVVDGGGNPSAIAFVVVGEPRAYPVPVKLSDGITTLPSHAYPQHLQPVLLPRVARPDEPAIQWHAFPLMPGFSSWKMVWGDELGPEGLALHYLRTLVAGGLPVPDAVKRVGKDVDADYLDRLLSQPPYVRALSRGEWSRVTVPLPDLAQQREIARKLQDRTADLYELACLLQNTDPRDGTRAPPHGSGGRMHVEFERLRQAVGEQRPGWVRRILGRFTLQLAGDESPVPGAGWASQIYERMSDAVQAASDAEQTRDIGLRVALLSSALARISAEPPQNRLDALLISSLRETLSRQRVLAVGNAVLRFAALHATGSDGTSEIGLRVVNEGRTALFSIKVTGTRVVSRSVCEPHIERVLEPSGRAYLNLSFPGGELGEDRVEVRWEARNVLGESMKGRVVLPITVYAGGSQVDVGQLWSSHRWPALEALSKRTDVPRVDSLLAQALVSLRAGDNAAAGATFTDLAQVVDTDEVSSVVLILAFLGQDRLALELAEEAWTRSDGDGDLAMALGRLRAWQGRTDAALAALHRAAADFETEALAVSAALLLRTNRIAAADQLRGIDRDASMRLALLPYQLLGGGLAEAQATLSELPQLDVDDDDVMWTILDLAHHGQADAARTILSTRPWHDECYRALAEAGLAVRWGRSEDAAAPLARLFGEGHQFAWPTSSTPVDLPPNPYVVAKPVEDGGRFFGRAIELQRILQTVAPPERTGVVLLEGARRVGKTSILHQVRLRMPSDTLSVFLNLQSLGSVRTDAGVWNALSRALRRAQGLTPAERRATELAGDYEAFADEIESVLALGRWRATVLLIDEFEVLDAAVEAGTVSEGLIGQLRHLAQTQPVGMVIAGAHELARSRKEYRSPLFGFAVVIRVAGLRQEDARELLVRPTQGLFDWTEDALTFALDLTEAHPFFLQHLGWQAYEARRSRPRVSAVGVAELERVVPDTIQAAEEHLDGLYATLSPLGRLLTRRLAAEPPLARDGLPREELIDACASYDSHEVLRTSLDDLEDRGVVVSATVPGNVRLAVCLLHYRVAERHPWSEEETR